MMNAIFWGFVVLWMLVIGGLIIAMSYQFAYIIQWQIKTITVLQEMRDDIKSIGDRINGTAKPDRAVSAQLVAADKGQSLK